MTDKYKALREAVSAMRAPSWWSAGMMRRLLAPHSINGVEKQDGAFIAAASPDVIASLLSDLDAANAKA